MMTGRILNIQRSSYHDGPGLRTTVFLKGCQLKCPWCHNPESISMEVQELRYPDKCIGCGKCDEGCFAGAREIVGRDVTIEDVLREINEDLPFYGKEGGVTVSGGEPLLQIDFLLALIDACHERDIQIAMESNLCIAPEKAKAVLEKIDLLMADVKIWNSERHRKIVGLSNENTLANLRLAAEIGKPIILRTPVIPGINADVEEIEKIAEFAGSLSTLMYYELLGYHPLGAGKAQALGVEQTIYEKPSKEMLNLLRESALKHCSRVLVNGREGELK